MDFKTISSIWQWAYITSRAMKTLLTLNKDFPGATLVAMRMDNEELFTCLTMLIWSDMRVEVRSKTAPRLQGNKSQIPL